MPPLEAAREWVPIDDTERTPASEGVGSTPEDEATSISLDTLIDPGESLTLAEIIVDRAAPRPDEAVVDLERSAFVLGLLGRLDPIARRVIRLRFGFIENRVYSSVETAQTLGIHRLAVERLERRALKRLRRWSAAPGTKIA